MSQNDELKQHWQKQLDKNRGGVADFWQANAAYWQTVADIMGARAATATSWWQSLPQHMQQFANIKTWPEFAEAFTKWQQQTWQSAWHLGVDTHQQRNHLWEEWQKLAQRNGMGPQQKPDADKPVAKSSFYAANPHLQPKPATQPAPQSQPKPAAPKAADPSPQPALTPVAREAASAPAPVVREAAPQAAPQAPAPIYTATHAEPLSEHNLNGHAQPEPARNAAQAATLAGASSARRSVIASHRSRAARRTTH